MEIPHIEYWAQNSTFLGEISEIMHLKYLEKDITHTWNLIKGTMTLSTEKKIMDLQIDLWLPRGRGSEWGGWGACG